MTHVAGGMSGAQGVEASAWLGPPLAEVTKVTVV